jgi:hypothetical protein
MSESVKNAVVGSSMNLLYSLSFYSPIIIIISVLLFSIFTASIAKASWYYLWIFVITFLRVILFKATGFSDQSIPEICSTGLTQIFIPKDVTYSTYLLSFTLMYFYLPMVMVSKQSNTNVINYGVLGFFIGYIVLDLFIKSSLHCIPSFFSKLVLGNIVSGLFLGGVIAGIIMYGSNLKGYLFINEINTNKEVCSMPSKQQFKCSVYKNGELVGSSIN